MKQGIKTIQNLYEELERQREALQCCIRGLQIEHDLLKTASELIK